VNTGTVERRRADPKRVVSELEHVRDISATEAGAQRVAWTEPWTRARAWLRGELDQLPVTIDTDEAGNTWATLAGRSPTVLTLGSHLDSVPDGGWLDGALGVVSALEVLRAFADGPQPPVTVRLADWADEEGARFGRSLFGSSAAAGLLDPDSVRDLTDADGAPLPAVLSAYGVTLDDAPNASDRLADVGAYLEMHIEQGPVLEDAGLALGVVDAVYGVERHRFRFEGQTAHSGSTPMRLRHDPLLAAGQLVLAVRDGAVQAGGVATVGEIQAAPGIPTAIPASVTLMLDQRHHDPDQLARMLDGAFAAARSAAGSEGASVEWTTILQTAPVAFDARLISLACESVEAVTGACRQLPSGALHDAVMVARAGVPTVMLFIQSLGGISHNRIEDSRREHIEQGVAALDVLAVRVAEELAAGAIR
jgi:beta-ureidopropionase / N-carbamoyl-L-amino-acid hydrolase